MNKSEQLIACLEGEIAKRDEELAACRVAVENCELFRARIAELEFELEVAKTDELSAAVWAATETIKHDLWDAQAELAALKAQEPVGSIEIQGTGFMCAPFPAPTWAGGRQPAVGTRLYAAPVSEAKAQGVVMPERWNVPRPMWKDARQPYGNPLNHADIEAAEKFNLALDEVARLNATPVHQVSVPDGWKLVPVEPTKAMLFACEDAGSIHNQQRGKRIYEAMLYAAPAAPVADAGLVDALGYQVLFDAIAAATSVYCGVGVNISVQAFRDALASHRAKGVV